MPVTTSKMCQLTNRMDDKPILLGGWLMFGVASQIASLNVQHNKSIFHHAKTSQTKIMSVGRRCCWGMSLRVNFRELSRKIIHQRDSWSALLFNTQQCWNSWKYVNRFMEIYVSRATAKTIQTERRHQRNSRKLFSNDHSTPFFQQKDHKTFDPRIPSRMQCISLVTGSTLTSEILVKLKLGHWRVAASSWLMELQTL